MNAIPSYVTAVTVTLCLMVVAVMRLAMSLRENTDQTTGALWP